MNYITTNIRLPEEDYLRLKEEAFQSRQSLASYIRQKIGAKTRVQSAEEIMAKTKSLAQKNARKLKGLDIVKLLREMRYEGKW